MFSITPTLTGIYACTLSRGVLQGLEFYVKMSNGERGDFPCFLFAQ